MKVNLRPGVFFSEREGGYDRRLYESGCWRQNLRETLIMQFEINGITGVGVAFKRKMRFFNYAPDSLVLRLLWNNEQSPKSVLLS